MNTHSFKLQYIANSVGKSQVKKGMGFFTAYSQFHNLFYSKLRRRNALVTTDTELRAMAAPANMGLSVGPPKRKSKPAATGIHKTL